MTSRMRKTVLLDIFRSRCTAWLPECANNNGTTTRQCSDVEAHQLFFLSCCRAEKIGRFSARVTMPQSSARPCLMSQNISGLQQAFSGCLKLFDKHTRKTIPSNTDAEEEMQQGKALSVRSYSLLSSMIQKDFWLPPPLPCIFHTDLTYCGHQA